MIEEAEKNASVDKTKKALVSVVYEFDNMLARIDILRFSDEYRKGPSESARKYFRKVIKALRRNYKRRSFKTIEKLLEGNFVLNAYESIAFDLILLRIKKPKKSLVIDITDDGE